MPSLTLNDRLIWFAHCPKAGGTSVEQVMVTEWGDAVGHLHWGWDLWWRQGGWRVANPPNSPQHLIWKDAVRALPRPPDIVFSVIRDPAARIMSEYRWQRRGRRGTWFGRLLAYLPFSLWLRLMLASARLNPHAFDNHFRPQTDFVPAGARVFHLEDGLAPVIAWLGEVTGTDVSTKTIPHTLSTGPAERIRPADLRLIAGTYAEDYARFGYPVPEPGSTSAPYDWAGRWFAPLIALLDRRGAL